MGFVAFLHFTTLYRYLRPILRQIIDVEKHLKFELTYSGDEADNNLLDLYDASQALLGFQRTLALTSHLVLNGEIITQATALKNAQILSEPPEAGSWKVSALIIGGIFALGTADKETPIGHLMYSSYDYVISTSLGVHVDYDETLGETYKRAKANRENHIPINTQSKFDALIEKCERGLKDMHRPVVRSETAQRASIYHCHQSQRDELTGRLTPQTYEYLMFSERQNEAQLIWAKVTSYNSNTFKGQCYTKETNRPIQFELSDKARTDSQIQLIVQSLTVNATDRSSFTHNGFILCRVFRNVSKKGRLKSFYIVEVGVAPKAAAMLGMQIPSL